jgi:Bacteriocin-protection, YdeI or OmpD-Associated/Domain of unknown function (DUF1905)
MNHGETIEDKGRAFQDERFGRMCDRYMSKIRFEARLTAVGPHTILRVPKAASRKLPSRGMNMVEGTLNGHTFQAPLEPDGMGSHWFSVSNTMLRAARAEVGDSVSVAVEPMARWPEPKVPADLAETLASDPEVRRLWMDITPVARWDWIRWIGATRNRDTRRIRIEKTLSKLKSGKRAACCFNRSLCTDPSMSRNGVLLEPTPDIRRSEGRQARSRRT